MPPLQYISDFGNSKHTKCNGKLPCEKCVKYSRICQYEAPYNRGKKPPIVAAAASRELLNSTPRSHDSETEHATSSRDSTRASEQVWGQNTDSLGVYSGGNRNRESDVSPITYTRTEVDEEEVALDYSTSRFQRHHEPDNGETIFQRTQHNLNHRATHRNSVFAFGDPPVPNMDTSFFALPAHKLAHTMVTQYFDFGAALHRFLHQKTVEEWMETLIARPRLMVGPDAAFVPIILPIVLNVGCTNLFAIYRTAGQITMPRTLSF